MLFWVAYYKFIYVLCKKCSVFFKESCVTTNKWHNNFKTQKSLLGLLKLKNLQSDIFFVEKNLNVLIMYELR